MMIVNPDKFQAIIIDIKNQQNNLASIKINDININFENSVRLLVLEIDSKLNFDKHITQLCKKIAVQVTALSRLKSFLNTAHRKILVTSFIYANYNYYPLVRHFCSKNSMNKIERIQHRALQFLHNDYDSDESEKCPVEVPRLRKMALEIFKS